MIFLFPLLIIIFICLLIAKLAGSTVTWGLVLLPLVIVFVLMLLFSMMGRVVGKKKKAEAEPKKNAVPPAAEPQPESEVEKAETVKEVAKPEVPAQDEPAAEPKQHKAEPKQAEPPAADESEKKDDTSAF